MFKITAFDWIPCHDIRLLCLHYYYFYQEQNTLQLCKWCLRLHVESFHISIPIFHIFAYVAIIFNTASVSVLNTCSSQAWKLSEIGIGMQSFERVRECRFGVGEAYFLAPLLTDTPAFFCILS